MGFQGLTEYPALVRTLYQAWAVDSYSIVGMATVLGLGSTATRLAVVLVGCGLLTGCWRYSRRGDDTRAFTCAVAAALAFTPIAWVHYLWFLLVPLGIARPRFSAVWLLPLLTWLVPRSGHGEGLQPFVPALVCALLIAFVLAPQRERVDVVVAT